MSTLVLSFSLGAAAAGGALAYLVAETRNRRERVALAREMTRQVRARYEAYVAMEGRVARVIDEFDRAESALNERLADQTRQMRRLHKALDGYEGRETQFAERAPVTVQVDALPSDLAAHHADEVAEMQDALALWRQRMTESSAEKEAEITRQTAMIDELTSRIESLAPLEGKLDEATVELSVKANALDEQTQALDARRSANVQRAEAASCLSAGTTVCHRIKGPGRVLTRIS